MLEGLQPAIQKAALAPRLRLLEDALAQVPEACVINVVMHLPEAFQPATLAAVQLPDLEEARGLKIPREPRLVVIVAKMIEVCAFFLPFDAKRGVLELLGDHHLEGNRRILLFELRWLPER